MRQYTNKEHTYFYMNHKVKDGLRNVARYNHTTLSNLLEEGAKMVIHRETMKMKEDMHDLKYIDTIMSH